MQFDQVAFDFSGLRALVVGGSRGIGRGVVQGLVAAGAEVAYAARAPAEPPVDGAVHVRVELRDAASIAAAFEQVAPDGRLDICVNAAAVNHAHGFEDITAEEWDEVLAIDLRAAFLVASEAGRRMKARGCGRIVNISSIAGRHRSPVSGVHYVSAKAGMIGLTRQMAFELAPFGVTVNAHCPSQTRTRMLESTMSEDQQADLVSAIPVGRLAEIIDQVGPVLFLCSDASRYMTGSVIDVNGGQL